MVEDKKKRQDVLVRASGRSTYIMYIMFFHNIYIYMRVCSINYELC